MKWHNLFSIPTGHIIWLVWCLSQLNDLVLNSRILKAGNFMTPASSSSKSQEESTHCYVIIKGVCYDSITGSFNPSLSVLITTTLSESHTWVGGEASLHHPIDWRNTTPRKGLWHWQRPLSATACYFQESRQLRTAIGNTLRSWGNMSFKT